MAVHLLYSLFQKYSRLHLRALLNSIISSHFSKAVVLTHIICSNEKEIPCHLHHLSKMIIKKCTQAPSKIFH